MKILKVLQINCASNGSTGNLAKSIHKALIDSGHESIIYYGIGCSDDKDIKPVSSMFFVHIHSVLSRYTGMQGYFSFIPTLKLIRKIKKFSPDIIHLHNLHGSYINLPILFRFLKKYNKKTVITLHDCWLFTGKCPHFVEVGCYRWLESCGNCLQLQTYPRSKFIDRTSKNLVHKKKWLDGFANLYIVTVSDWLKEMALRSHLNKYPIQRIYNGIDTTVFYPRDTERVVSKYNIKGKFIILGVASSWDDRKGLKEFIKIANEFPQDVVILVGLSQEQSEKLPDNILTIHRTENKNELAEIYSAADVFMNFSKEETFGLVVTEAMACGTPAIVYNSTACPEVITPETGFVAEPTQFNQIVNTIERIKRKELVLNSEDCVENVKNNYNKELMCKRYIDFYGTK